jgi:hypothetical protein
MKRAFIAHCHCDDSGACRCTSESDIASITAMALQQLDQGVDVRIQLANGRSFPSHLKYAELEAIERHPSIHRVA